VGRDIILKKAIFIIEHLEETLGQWILLEYENVAKIVGKENLIVTNIKDNKEILTKIANTVVSESAVEFLKKFKSANIIVLDPQAEIVLEPEDFVENRLNVVIVGGILGDHPPKGRTHELLTKKFLRRNYEVKVRHLGKEQLTIDGAVYVAYQILRGKRVSEIPFTIGLTIIRKVGYVEHEIILPYKYPLVNGKPLVNPKLINYLAKGIVVDEIKQLSKP